MKSEKGLYAGIAVAFAGGVVGLVAVVVIGIGVMAVCAALTDRTKSLRQ